MTVKELKKEYDYVVKFNNQYLIHSKGGKRSVYKYLATVNKSGGSMFVTGYKPTTKIKKLKEQVEDYVSSLPYDSEYYSPMFRKGYREEIIVHDYLESIKFSHLGDGIYKLNTPSIYGYQATNVTISFSNLSCFGKIKDNIEIRLSTGNFSWVTAKCKREVDDIIKTVDSLLKPLLVTESVSNVKISDEMVMSDVNLTLKKLKGLNIEETDMKEYLKKQLLTIANTL